jgi:hypothetical protein
MDSRAAEVAKLERERKFNADEMCYVSAEKSLVGRHARRWAGDAPRCRRC